MNFGDYLISRSSLSSGTMMELIEGIEGEGGSDTYIFRTIDVNVETVKIEADIDNKSVQIDMQNNMIQLAINNTISVDINNKIGVVL